MVGQPYHILVVEDSRIFAAAMRRELAKIPGVVTDWAASMAEAEAFLKVNRYELALLDVVLPDSSDGEVIELCTRMRIPSIVFTSMLSADFRERIMSMDVLDYIVKDSPTSMSMLMGVTQRLIKNKDIKALVVDDSKTARTYMQDLLVRYGFRTLTATNGAEAIDILRENLDIRLVLTDYHMPVMDGIEMIKLMRITHPKDKVAIIGLSSGGGSAAAAMFIKNGANDFLTKPFLREEFFFRISQTLDMLDLIQQVKDVARKDFLTGLFNRRYLAEAGGALIASARRGRITVTGAVLDIDHFKKVNDTYGHDTGDEVLMEVARRLQVGSRESDMVVRLGGEEFCVLAVNQEPGGSVVYFERLREAIEKEPVSTIAGPVNVTISIGVSEKIHASIDDMLTTADAALYTAKHNGRNRVEFAV